jgi:hypothetical protein
VRVVNLSSVYCPDLVTHSLLLRLPLDFQVDPLPDIVPFVLILFVRIFKIVGVIEGKYIGLASMAIDNKLALLCEGFRLFVIIDFLENFVVELDIDAKYGCDLS